MQPRSLVLQKERRRPLTKERMAPDERPPALRDRWHINGLHVPVSEDYDHLLVARDVATKPEILMEIIRRFGIPPKEVTTDRGRAFRKVCEKFLIMFKPVWWANLRQMGWLNPSTKLKPTWIPSFAKVMGANGPSRSAKSKTP